MPSLTHHLTTLHSSLYNPPSMIIPTPPIPKAITEIDVALRAFEQLYKIPPRVILLPTPLFERYAAEAAALDAVLPNLGPMPPAPGWTDVRVVEHDAIQEIEVY